MNQLSIQHSEKVLAAWQSICDWCKDNCANVIPNGLVAPFDHNPHGWKCLAVTESGDVQLHCGSHGDDSTEVYTRNNAMFFASRYQGGGDSVHSYFASFKNCPHETNEAMAKRCKDVHGLAPDSATVNLSAIEEAVYEWRRVKNSLVYQLDRARQLDSFIA